MNIRNTIRNIILESKFVEKNDSVMEDEAIIRNTIASFNLVPYGYTIQSVVKEETGFLDELLYTITMQHTKPDFKKYVNQMAARGGKFATIYGDTPTSKTMITRWLTGFKDGADIDERQKSAAIKVAQVAGLDALAPLIQLLEATYNCTCVANFTGAKTKNKGLSFFEFYVFDNSKSIGSTPPELPEPPMEVPVDDEVVELPPDPPVPPKEKKPKKPRKKSKRKKKPKLTASQRKAGYNQIDADGRLRHVVPLDELEYVTDHIIDLVMGSGTSKKEIDNPMGLYTKLKNKSYDNEMGVNGVIFRVVDDYFEDDAPILKMYKAYIIEGGKIRSRSMMQQYLSLNSGKEQNFNIAKGHSVIDSPTYSIDKQGDFTPPKLGGKEAKDVRRYVSQERVNDEMIIYANVKPKTNKYTQQQSKHTGDVTLYVFLLDRNLER